MRSLAVLHAENPISSCSNINLHVMRCGQWISPYGIVYMTQDVAMEASYTIHKNDY